MLSELMPLAVANKVRMELETRILEWCVFIGKTKRKQ